MALTLSNLRDYISHILSGSGMDTSLPGSTAAAVGTNTVNMAGRWFYSHHFWNFRLRPSATLTFTSGQDYVELPPDFGVMNARQMGNSLASWFSWGDIQQILNYRATTLNVAQSYYIGAIVQPSQVSKKDAPGPPRIELWPTPTNSTSTLNISYFAKWVDLIDDDDVADVPDYCEFPLAMACRAFAAGLEEQEVAGKDVHERLEPLMNSTLFTSAYEADGSIQNEYGPMTGGAIQQGGHGFSWVNVSNTLNDPS